jgi:hypothetical protein
LSDFLDPIRLQILRITVHNKIAAYEKDRERKPARQAEIKGPNFT